MMTKTNLNRPAIRAFSEYLFVVYAKIMLIVAFDIIVPRAIHNWELGIVPNERIAFQRPCVESCSWVFILIYVLGNSEEWLVPYILHEHVAIEVCRFFCRKE